MYTLHALMFNVPANVINYYIILFSIFIQCVSFSTEHIFSVEIYVKYNIV